MTDNNFNRDALSFLFPGCETPKDPPRLIKGDLPSLWAESRARSGLTPSMPSFHSEEEIQDNYLMKLDTDDSACKECCSKRLIITIERHTAVMLENKKWWGIVGTMTAGIASQNTFVTTGNSSGVTKPDIYPKLTTVSMTEELPFTTPTFEQKGPPTKEGGIKRAVPPGTYQTQAINGDRHSTYQFNRNAGFKKLRGINIFGKGGGYSPLSDGRGIDIHVGGNATFTTGCIVPAPGITYKETPKNITAKDKKILLDEQNRIRESFGVTKHTGSYEFMGTRPTWSANASQFKVTQLIEMIEDFKGIARGKLQIKKTITCVDIVIKNPPDNIFKNVVVLSGIFGPISDKVKIDSVSILNENEYTCISGGITYHVTAKKTEDKTNTTYTVDKL